jgi:polyhydroxybutyrate depolymerase
MVLPVDSAVLRTSLAALVVGLLLVGACGGDDDEASPATTTSTTIDLAAHPEATPARPSPGCGHSTVGAVARERHTLTIAGEERWYLLTTPNAHDGTTPLPLVVELHGLAEGAAIAAQMSQLDTIGEREGFVMAYPNGSGSPVRWDQHLDSSPNHDFELISTLLDTLGDELCIDEARVYATGLSYGAIMSSALACAMPDRFAAIAPVAGVEHPDACAPDQPVPVLAFHGTADPILLFNGGVGDLTAALSGGSPAPPSTPADVDGPGYPAAVKAWAKANGCGDATDERRSAHVIERTYDCDPNAEVRFFIVEGGGHSWPGSAFSAAIAKVVGPTTDELDASEEIWSFFSRHALTP